MKKVFSHNLPVSRVIYANGNGNKERTILHVSDSIHKEEFGNTYWHTRCGKNIDWHSNPNDKEMGWALNNENDYSFCRHCGTPEAFGETYVQAMEYDITRRNEERKQEELERCSTHERMEKSYICFGGRSETHKSAGWKKHDG